MWGGECVGSGVGGGYVLGCGVDSGAWRVYGSAEVGVG